MKKLLFSLFALLLSATNIEAQNPYAPLGIEEQVLHYDEAHKEVFDNDTLKSIGYGLYSPASGLLAIFDLKDSLVRVEKIDPSKMARWLSVDPLAGKYPGMSPYNFVGNSPLIGVDPDGRDVIFLNDKEGAGGNGHMAMLIQDRGGNWYHFSQGAAEQANELIIASNCGLTGGVMVQPMIKKNSAGNIVQMTMAEALAAVKSGQVDGSKYDESSKLKTSKQQDTEIFANALALKRDYEIGEEKYRLFSNNCVDAMQAVVQGDNGATTGIILPDNTWTPKPNSYFSELKRTMPYLNREVEIKFPESGLDNYPSKPITVPIK